MAFRWGIIPLTGIEGEKRKPVPATDTSRDIESRMPSVALEELVEVKED